MGRGKKETDVDLACLLQSSACCSSQRVCWAETQKDLPAPPFFQMPRARRSENQCWKGSQEKNTEAHPGRVRPPGAGRVGHERTRPCGEFSISPSPAPTLLHMKGMAPEWCPEKVHEPVEVGRGHRAEQENELLR